MAPFGRVVRLCSRICRNQRSVLRGPQRRGIASCIDRKWIQISCFFTDVPSSKSDICCEASKWRRWGRRQYLTPDGTCYTRVTCACTRTTHAVTSFENVNSAPTIGWLCVPVLQSWGWCSGTPPLCSILFIIYAINASSFFLALISFMFTLPVCCAFISIIFPFCVSCPLQLLMDSQMNRRSSKKWLLTLRPMKWLLTWPNGTKRYSGVTTNGN